MKEQEIECSGCSAVLYTAWFKIIALVCIMDSSNLLHGGAYWIVPGFLLVNMMGVR